MNDYVDLYQCPAQRAVKCNSQYLGVIPVPPVGIQMYGSPWQTKPGVFISDLDAVPPGLLGDGLPMRMSAIGTKWTFNS
jgi:hypothetical protein